LRKRRAEFEAEDDLIDDIAVELDFFRIRQKRPKYVTA
jgi:hypothetical protein